MGRLIDIMLKILSCFLFFALSLNLIGQNLVVLDSLTNSPIPYVSVTNHFRTTSESTNINGIADLKAFNNNDTIIVSTINYNFKKTTLRALKESDYKILLSPAIYKLGTVVVSANKWVQKEQEIPFKVEMLENKALFIQNKQTAADMIGVAPGVFIQKSQQGGGSPIIRGFSSNRLLYSVDGVRMNNAIFRSGNLHNVISLDPFSIEKTEVLFGPSSVVYGSDALGGVMSFHTLKPLFAADKYKLLSANYVTRLASANLETSNHFDFNLGSKKLSLLTSITFTDYNSVKMGKNGPDEYLNRRFATTVEGKDAIALSKDPKIQNPSGFSQLNLMQKIAYKFHDSLILTYAAHFSETSDIPRYDRLSQEGESPESLRYAEWYYGPQGWKMQHLSLEYKAKNTFFNEMKFILAYQVFEESRINRRFNSTSKNINEEKVDAYSLNLDFLKQLKKNASFSYGIEGILNNVSSIGSNLDLISNIKTPSVSRYPESDWSSLAIYSTFQTYLTKKISIHSGLRFNHIELESEFDQNLSPFPFEMAQLKEEAITGNIGLVYKPTQSLSYNILFSSGFRAPNADDIGKVFDSEPGSVTIPNNNIKPEFAYNYEAGIIKRIPKKYFFEFSVFYTQLKDAMVRRNYSFFGQDSIIYEGELSQIQAIQNASKAFVYGAQLNIDINLSKNILFKTELSFQYGEEELDDKSVSPSRHVTPAFGRSQLRFKKKKTEILLVSNYSGGFKAEELNVGEKNKPHLYAIDSNGNPYSPSWYTIDLKVSQALSKNFMLSGGVENISDMRYRTYSSGVTAPGRNFILSLKANL